MTLRPAACCVYLVLTLALCGQPQALVDHHQHLVQIVPGGPQVTAADEALQVYIEALRRGDPRMARVIFDVPGIAGLGKWQEKSAVIVECIRQIGLQRIYFGSDVGLVGKTPRDSWNFFRQLPLTDRELETISQARTPYMR